MDRFVFPPWVNTFTLLVIGGVLAAGAYAGGMLFYSTLPTVMLDGYQPEQPVPYSHKLHAGELKIDCRYCHQNVDRSAHATIPATATCGNCHSGAVNADGTLAKTVVHATSLKLQPIRDSLANGGSVEWDRIHDLADYVYFNHAAHVTRGVGCVECHGRIDKMEVVYQHEPLSMSWCLDCHRNPTARLRPLDQITNMAWDPETTGAESRLAIGQRVADELGIHPNTNCSTCHR